MNPSQPHIVEETNCYAVVFKPPRMHSAPLKQKDGGTLLEWYALESPPVYDLVHRLDYETHGLVLFAKTRQSYDFFKDLQDTGGFLKEYSAVCSSYIPKAAPGFPPPPALTAAASAGNPQIIESYFRPYGPGRKQVRPVLDEKIKHYETAKDKGAFYKTEITGINNNIITVRIKRGFRHQIRCHLCWAGLPILNDPLYGCSFCDAGIPAEQTLSLRAHALFFADPLTGGRRECRIDPVT